MLDLKAKMSFLTADSKGHEMTGDGAGCLPDSAGGEVVADWFQGIRACKIRRMIDLRKAIVPRIEVRFGEIAQVRTSDVGFARATFASYEAGLMATS